MPAAMGAVESCQETYRKLEEEMDAVLERLVSAAESGAGFYRSMERAEEQLASAQKLLARIGDLELNETAVIAEKIEEELAAAEKCAPGAALSESQEEWAGHAEKARDCLDRLSAQMRKMRAAAEGGEPLEVRFAILAFRRDEKACRAHLGKAKAALSVKKHPVYSKLRFAKRKVQLLKLGVASALENIARGRLRKKIAEAREGIEAFLKNSASARLFVDPKHLTLVSGSHKERIPLTQSVRFALEEIAPVGKSLARLGRSGTVLVGYYEKNGNGGVLRIGERTVAGDSVIYHEQSVELN